MYKKNKNLTVDDANSHTVIEAESIKKNGVSTKNLIMSRNNRIKDTALETSKPVKRILLRVIGNISMLVLLLLFTGCNHNHPGEPEMVFVEGGTFTMGFTFEQEREWDHLSKPAHSVTVNNFQISKYEITQAQWKAVMETNPSCFTGDDSHPVETVTWDDVQEFISRLNAATGKSYRLPTEAEWEYAARGGNRSQGYEYSGGNNLSEVAWQGERYGTGFLHSRTRPVGLKKANELGIHDMSGNVYEWCQDWYGKYPAAPQQNPVGASDGSDRIYRGGCNHTDTVACRVSHREFQLPSYSSCTLGFRIVCSSK